VSRRGEGEVKERDRGTGFFGMETIYWKKDERPTSNIEHRISNIELNAGANPCVRPFTSTVFENIRERKLTI